MFDSYIETMQDIFVALLQVIPTLLIAYLLLDPPGRPLDSARHRRLDEPDEGAGPRAARTGRELSDFRWVASGATVGTMFTIFGAALGPAARAGSRVAEPLLSVAMVISLAAVILLIHFIARAGSRKLAAHYGHEDTGEGLHGPIRYLAIIVAALGFLLGGALLGAQGDPPASSPQTAERPAPG